jgi:hypothetical protein
MRNCVTWIMLFLLFSCNSGSEEEKGSFTAHAGYIQVVLFHMEQRCESCDAVEIETENLLNEEYTEELQSGEVKFISLNYQSEKGKKAAKLLQATGQTLYVVKGDSISNLTSPAFMYAHTHPEYYLDALREELDKYLE